MFNVSVSGGQIGSLFANIFGGLIMNYGDGVGNWPFVFYYYGAAGVLCSLAWYLLLYSNPEEHPHISEKEKLYLQQTIGSTHRKKVSSPTVRLLISESLPTIILVANLFFRTTSQRRGGAY